MKVFGKWLSVLILSGSAVLLSAQSVSASVTEIKLKKAGFSETPKFDIAMKGYGIPAPSKRSPWYMVVLEYVINDKTAVKKGKKVAKNSPILQDFELDLYISLPGRPGTDVSKRILLTGNQRFWMVKANNAKHYALFLVPPMIFEQFSYDPADFDKLVHQQRGNGVEGIKIMAVFKNGRDTLGWEVFPVDKNSTVKKIQTEFRTLTTDRTVFKIENGILPKEKTPWQWLDTDIFDLPASLFEGRSNGRQF